MAIQPQSDVNGNTETRPTIFCQWFWVKALPFVGSGSFYDVFVSGVTRVGPASGTKLI